MPIYLKNKPKRFSLVELLVVISILAILISMLSPSLKQAMEKAHVINCSSKLKHLGFATSLYTLDHDGRYMMPTLTLNTSPDQEFQRGRIDWTDLISGYDGRPALTGDALHGEYPWEEYFDEDEFGHRKEMLGMFQCPSSQAAEYFTETRWYGEKLTYARNSYGLHMSADPRNPHSAAFRGVFSNRVQTGDGLPWDASPGPDNWKGWSATVDSITNPRGLLMMEYHSASNAIGNTLDLSLRYLKSDIGPYSQSQVGQNFRSLDEAWIHGLFEQNVLHVDGAVSFLHMSETTEDDDELSWFGSNQNPDERGNKLWDLFPDQR
jgi:competence protein ComGC